MHLVLQRSPDPVPYLGAYLRLAGTDDSPARARIVLPPQVLPETDHERLARLLGLALALGDPPGGPPIRQFWLGENLSFRGKLDEELAPHLAARAQQLARRVQSEWDRFLGNALARLRGEPRGDAHFRDPEGGWSPEHPATRVVAWPPLPGEALPALE